MLLKRVALSALAICLASCGGGGSGRTAPPIPQRTTVYQASFALDPQRIAIGDFQAPAAGTLTVVVDWTAATDDVDVLLVNRGCVPVLSLVTSTCQTFASDVRKFVKPAQLTYQTGAGTDYRLLVANSGPNFETGTVNVYLDR